MSRKISILHVIKVILKLTFEKAPIITSIVLFTGICHGIFKGLEAVAMQSFFDNVTLWLDEKTAIKNMLGSFLFLAVVFVLAFVFNGIHNAMVEIISFKTIGAMTVTFHKKAKSLTAEFYENAENLDTVEKARAGIEKGTFFLNVLFCVFTYYIPYFLFMGGYLIALKPIFVWTLMLVFVPVILSQTFRNRMYAKCHDEAIVHERKYRHYQECIMDKRYFKETRMWGAFHFFEKKYIDSVCEHDKIKWNTVRSTGLIELGSKMIVLFGYLLIIFMFVIGVLHGEISIGTFAALFLSVNTMFHTMEELICGHIESINENLSSVKNYVHFLELPLKKGTKKIEGAVIFEGNELSYCYPDSDKVVLKNINFRIHQGEKIAIVGENGAGKSTLMKLLCGQYIPVRGQLLINGVDSKDIENPFYMENISAVLQDYQKYALDLEKNVSISDYRKKKNEDHIEKLLQEAGVNTDKLPDGLKTKLVREFGGIDLSGGEWQKVSIARGAYKSCKFIVLDEPTAAIDPVQENKLYHLFREMSEDKTAVIITHRLGAARLADRIFVLQNGEIVESGSHEQLLQKRGKYFEMYEMQKEMYYSNS